MRQLSVPWKLGLSGTLWLGLISGALIGCGGDLEETEGTTSAVNAQCSTCGREPDYDNPGYSHDDQVKTSNPRWMTALKDSTRLSELSIPGTHDTMSFYGGDAGQNQAMSLRNQLQSGIRTLDIRCHQAGRQFDIYHGGVYQWATFGDDVLEVVVAFLKENPGETVLVKVLEEHRLAGDDRTFEEIFVTYHQTYSRHIWSVTSDNPSLGEIRGKIVILQEFQSPSGATYGIDYHYRAPTVQDDYRRPNNWDLYDKWLKVKAHLAKADGGASNERYFNYLSGAEGSLPYFVASGHSSPGTSAPRLSTGRTTPLGNSSWPDFPRVNCFLGSCTIAFEGTNTLTYEWLGLHHPNRVGTVMADFPGPGLIKRTIDLNARFKAERACGADGSSCKCAAGVSDRMIIRNTQGPGVVQEGWIQFNLPEAPEGHEIQLHEGRENFVPSSCSTIFWGPPRFRCHNEMWTLISDPNGADIDAECHRSSSWVAHEVADFGVSW